MVKFEGSIHFQGVVKTLHITILLDHSFFGTTVTSASYLNLLQKSISLGSETAANLFPLTRGILS